MVTLDLSSKELLVLRFALCQRLVDLRCAELDSLRSGLSADKIRKQIVFAESLLSKLC